MDIGSLVQMILEIVLTIVLPLLLKKLVDWLNGHIKELNARKDLVQLETAVMIIRQLVQAAEMNGLAGRIENIGKEKKRYVIDMAEAALAKRGIDIDLDVLDAMVESQVKEAIKDIDALYPVQLTD